MEERVRRTEIHLLSRDMEGWEGVNSTSKAKELAKRYFFLFKLYFHSAFN